MVDIGTGFGRSGGSAVRGFGVGVRRQHHDKAGRFPVGSTAVRPM